MGKSDGCCHTQIGCQDSDGAPGCLISMSLFCDTPKNYLFLPASKLGVSFYIYNFLYLVP